MSISPKIQIKIKNTYSDNIALIKEHNQLIEENIKLKEELKKIKNELQEEKNKSDINMAICEHLISFNCDNLKNDEMNNFYSQLSKELFKRDQTYLTPYKFIKYVDTSVLYDMVDFYSFNDFKSLIQDWSKTDKQTHEKLASIILSKLWQRIANMNCHSNYGNFGYNGQFNHIQDMVDLIGDWIFNSDAFDTDFKGHMIDWQINAPHIYDWIVSRKNREVYKSK